MFVITENIMKRPVYLGRRNNKCVTGNTFGRTSVRYNGTSHYYAFAPQSQRYWGKGKRHDSVWGSGGIASPVLRFTSSWKWTVSFTRRLYSRGKHPLCPLHNRLDGPQGWSGRCEEEKKISLSPMGITPWFFGFPSSNNLVTAVSAYPGPKKRQR